MQNIGPQMNEEFVAKLTRILNDYIHFLRPLEELDGEDEIQCRDWGYPALAIATRNSMKEVLNKYLKKQISEKDLYYWAHGVSGRNTIFMKRVMKNLLLTFWMKS